MNRRTSSRLLGAAGLVLAAAMAALPGPLAAQATDSGPEFLGKFQCG